MQDRIKELAIEAGAAFDDTFESVGSNPMYLLTPDELARFAQAIARECAEIVEAKSVSSYRATELAANAIRARFGLGE
jgi:hypothetical protein